MTKPYEKIPLIYQGRELASVYNFVSAGRGEGFVMAFNGIGDLETLLKLGPEDRLEFNGKSMTYQDFRNNVLSKPLQIYPTEEDYSKSWHRAAALMHRIEQEGRERQTKPLEEGCVRDGPLPLEEGCVRDGPLFFENNK